MKIAFFEIHEWEKEILQKTFKAHDLHFFTEELSDKNVSKVKDAEIISVFIYSKITPKLLQKLSNLKLLTTRSMGTDHIDLQACKKQNILVATAPHYGDNSVAEHTFALMLSISRNINKAYIRTKNEDYTIEGLKGFDLKGKTLGVLGVGRIGSNVVKIARAFQMPVLASDHHPDKKFARDFKFKYTTVNDVIKNADILTLHVPYCKENHHLINKKTISKMKKGSILINTSRGSVVETKALMDALNSGHLAGAGLDVIEGEELIKEEKELLYHPGKLNAKKLRQIIIDHHIVENEKVVFTPHIAFFSQEAVMRILEVTIENISSFLKKKPINLIVS